MIGSGMEIELARQEWEHGRRRVESTASDPAAHERLLLQVDIVTAELRRRIGQTFTVSELVELYTGADRWALEALDRVLDQAPAEVSTVAGAAFAHYARRAYDYAP